MALVGRLAVVLGLALALALLLLVASVGENRTVVAGQGAAPTRVLPAAAEDCGEEYVWVGALSKLPVFEARDFPALRSHAAELGVCARVAGPAGYDLTGEVEALGEACAAHPAGVMVLGLDAGLGPAIDACVAARVPTVTVDVDVPGSDRLAFIGADPVSLGGFVGQHVAAWLKAHGTTSGEVAETHAVGVAFDDAAAAAFADALSADGTFIPLGSSDDGGTAEGAAAAEAALIKAHPHLVASVHFGTESGPGALRAVTDAGRAGHIAVFASERGAPFAAQIRDGGLAATFGPAREKNAWYGLEALYDFNHATLSVDGLDRWAAPPIPSFYDVGAVWVDEANVEDYLAAHPG